MKNGKGNEDRLPEHESVRLRKEKMKKYILFAVLLTMLCTGCGENTPEEKREKGEDTQQITETPGSVHEFDVQVLADELKDSIAFEDELNEGQDIVFQKRYGLEAEDYVKQSSYFSSNATTEEIAVVECGDEAAAKAMEEVFLQRIEEQKVTFADYAPAEVQRLDKAVVRVLGKYVVLCVTADPEAAGAVINQY